MKKQLIISLFAAAIMFAGEYNSYAEMCGCMGRPGDGMHEEAMPPMRGMQHPGRGMMSDEHPMWRHLMGLGLNEKQKAEVKEIRHRVMKDMVKKKADGLIARTEMKELIDRDPVEMKAVEAKLKQIETLNTEMQLSFIGAVEEAKSKLTPEQREKLKETFSEMGPMMGGGGMMHGGMRMPTPCEKEEMQ